jgi:DNA topoisomerase-6 subunit A
MPSRRESTRDSIKKKRETIINNLEDLGKHIYDQMNSGEFPWVKMLSRSIANINYDTTLRQYVLGKRTTRRSARNIRHIRPFTQLTWVADFVHDLCKKNKTSTLRDVYYSAQAYDMSFKDQQESDSIITDLETVAGGAREDFHVFPEERSAIFGDLTIEYTIPGYEGRRLNLTSHPDGVMIGPALTSAEFVDTKADKVIVIEKGAIFTRFVEERAYKTFKSLLIHTAGQPPRATRCLIRRLNRELDLPVYIFTDGDPWGMHIAMVIISGSANCAHLTELTTPNARWSGVWATDILKYKLPTERLTDLDMKRLYELQKDPRYDAKLWKREISTFIKDKRKCELEAFSRYGLTYLVEKYLPERFKELAS